MITRRFRAVTAVLLFASMTTSILANEQSFQWERVLPIHVTHSEDMLAIIFNPTGQERLCKLEKATRGEGDSFNIKLKYPASNQATGYAAASDSPKSNLCRDQSFDFTVRQGEQESINVRIVPWFDGFYANTEINEVYVDTNEQGLTVHCKISGDCKIISDLADSYRKKPDLPTQGVHITPKEFMQRL